MEVTLIPLIKYVLVVLQANDNGDGGTFALYSLLCRHAKISLTPSQQAEDSDVANFKLEVPSRSLKMASRLKSTLENSQFAKVFLLFATMLGTSMVIGDGVLIPSISGATSAMTEDMIVWISVAILIFLFMIQRFGTDKVGYSFAPILCIWFLFIGGIGMYNFIRFDPTVIKAINPQYLVDYFIRNKKEGWISLGGVILCITGPLYWPMFVVSVLASVIASQSMISATFSIIQQSLSLGCFPRVKIVHTSSKYEGQVYVPEANYILMLACVGVTLAFRTTTKIGNALGIEVVFVMTLTSSFLVLIMIMIWKTHMLLIISYLLIIGSMELLYLSSVLAKKYYYELDHKISPEKLKQIADNRSFCRMPGLAIFYSELVHGIPPIFNHYVANVPALHSVLVFVSIKHLPIGKVPVGERFLFRRVELKELNVFRCVARYGYTDLHNEQEPFEVLLVRREIDEIQQEVPMETEIQLEVIDKAWRSGVVRLIGENEVISAKGADIAKRILIDYAYNFLKRNLRQRGELFDIPQKRMLKVSMTYEL
ncbi:hypothetical protein M0R45_031668 [Rubus argutus]|uniref:Potassium transporter n=1 Tax=Rubus argutus TaxID=59490 RepID=A0AAW1WGH8_RUBAR